MSATVNGVATHWFEEGDGDPLLLVHGSGPGIDGEITWRPILPALAARHRTIVVDAPGYGRSDMLDVPDTPANVAAHLVALLDHLGIDRLPVVGHSRGGRIACELALASPERVSRLVVVCAGSVAPGGHLTDDGGFTESAISLVRYGADGDPSLDKFKAAYRSMVVVPEHLPDDLLERAHAEFMATRYEEYVRRMVDFDPLAFYHRESAQAFAERLRGLAVPTSVVWGREDLTSAYQRAVPLLDLVPDLELHVLPRCGHFAQMDRPVALANLILDFVARDRAPLPG